MDLPVKNTTVTPVFEAKATETATESAMELTTESPIELATDSNLTNETTIKMPSTKSMVFDNDPKAVLEPEFAEMNLIEPSTKSLVIENESKNVSGPEIDQLDLSVEDLDAVDAAIDEFFLDLLILANNGSKQQHCLINQNSKNNLNFSI